MTEFERLKNECAELLKRTRSLEKDLCTDIYFKDIHILEEKMPGRIVKNSNGDYVLDKTILIRITEDKYSSTLEFEDRRASAFLWVFTAEMQQYYVSDNFSYGDSPFYSVNFLREGQIPNGEDEIQKVIAKLKDTISQLEAKPMIEDVSYSYVCVNPYVECKDISEVIEMVLSRRLKEYDK